MKAKVQNIILDNFSYKVVSLFIALILWMTILGRRDFTVSRNIEVEFLVGTEYSLVSQNVDHVKVKATGPRTALRRFMDSGASQVIAIDLTQRGDGHYEVDIPNAKVDVPFGVKIQSISPNKIFVQVGKKEK